MTLASNNPSEATTGPVTVTITASLQDYPGVSSVSETIDVKIIDLCLSTSLSFNPMVSNMIAYPDSSTVSQVVTAVDTVSTN